MRSVSAICALTLVAALVVGCLNLGEKPTPGRKLVLSFPESVTNSLPAAEAPQVKQALLDVEELLRKEGYGRVSNPIEEKTPGYVATFAQTDQHGFKSYCNPLLKVHQADVLIIFDELGNRGGHLQSETKRLVKLLRKELSQKYGETRVKEVP